MNVALKNTDDVNAIVTVTVSKDDYAEKVEKKLKEYRRKANVPGFRPGMVPMGLVKKMYGKAVTAEEVNGVLSDALYNYIKEQNLDILGEPLPNETEQKAIDFDSEEPLEFVFDIALAPVFDLQLSKKDKIAYYDITITDEMIDSQVKSYCGRFGSYEPAESVEENDVLKGDVTEVGNDECKIEGVILSPMHLKDADQKGLFVGKKVGDIVTFNPQKAMNNAAEIASFLKKTKEEAEAITSDFAFEIKQITRYKEAAIDAVRQSIPERRHCRRSRIPCQNRRRSQRIVCQRQRIQIRLRCQRGVGQEDGRSAIPRSIFETLGIGYQRKNDRRRGRQKFRCDAERFEMVHHQR